MNKAVITLIIIAVLIGGAWYLYTKPSDTPQASGTTDNTNTPATPPPTSDTSSTPTESTSGVKEFTISGQNFSFSPSAITVKKGDTVKITFKNISGFHDFHIDEFNVATKQISGGTQETVEFSADKSGSFEYYCSVGNHRAMGMRGTLTVE